MSSLRNIKYHVQAVRQNDGVLATDQVQIVTRAAVPTDDNLANGRIVYVTGTGFRAYAEGAWFTIPTSTTGGSGSSWDTLYSADKSLTIDGASLTFAGIHASNDAVTISNTGSGAALQFTSTSGKDIDGTGSAWSITYLGAAVLTAITGCDALTAAANLALNATGAGTIAIGNVSSGAVTITPALTATASITITGSADADVLTITAGDILVSNGILSLDSDDITTGNLVIPSSTATSGNVISITADDLTSGAAIFIDSDNGASFSSNGGYIHLNDGTNPIFTVKQYGATVIAGNAATDILTITAGHAKLTSGNLTLTSGNLVMTSGSFTYSAGDMTMGDGSITITDADDAASFQLTNNTATTATVIKLAGSGVHTGTGTTSFMTLTPSGMTTGTALYIPAAAATTSVGVVDIIAAALTSGTALRVTTSTAAFTTGGKAIEVDLVAAIAGNGVTITTTGAYNGTGMEVITMGAAVSGIGLSLISTTGMTTGSLLRATSSTAGAVGTNGVISIRATGAFTSTTIGYVDILASSAIAGTVLRVANSAAQTTGTIFMVTQTGTTTTFTGNVASITGSSTTGQANTLLVTGVHTTLGNVVSITNTSASQTGAILLNVTQSATTTGFTGSVVSVTSSSTTGSGSGVLVTMVNTTAGDGLKIVSNALTLGAATALNISHTTSVLGAGTSLARITSTGVDTGTTTGTLLDLAQTAAVGNVAVLLTDSSADTAARTGVKIAVTNAAAVGAVPLLISNVAVTGTGSKFVKGMSFYNGTKTNSIWTSIDATTPNGALTAVAGDICLNGPSSVPFYCTGTNVWVALA